MIKFVSCLKILPFVLVAAVPAAAQNNSVIIEQIAPAGLDSGNTLRVDQSDASNALVAGAPPADQTGAPFSDEVINSLQTNGPETVTQDGNVLTFFNASSAATQSGIGNSATITMVGDSGTAGLEQLGNDNIATIDVLADNAFGSVFQQGDENDGTVTVDANGGFGELVQIGDRNETVLSVSGNPNAAVSFTIQGNDVSSAVPASIVTQSGGRVTIIQRQLNSLAPQ